ncbi:unnamed protein product [Lampetra fluviatilis]
MSRKMGLTERLSLPALLICLPFLLFILGLTDADSPPHFTRTPVDQSGVSSGVAAFVCKTAGDPRPRITWMKKGKRVSSQRFEVTEFEDGSGSVLRIQPLRTPRDEGEYECTASNGVGVATASATLTVYREDQLPMGFPVIDNGPVLRVVERTRLATMLCVVSGTPDPEITWYKDLLPVDTGYNQGRIKQLRSGALQIENSQDSDQGKYECVATNSVGTRFSAPAKLFVKVRTIPPRFTIVPTNQEVVPGGSINITCVAMGSPMPFVKWMLGTQALTPADEMPIGLNMLQLTDVRSSNNYTCVAMSSLGVIEAVVQVAVKALPRPPGTPLVTETTATSITLTWDSGNVEPVLHYVLLLKARPGHSNNNNNDNANNDNSNEEKEDEEEFSNSSGGGGGGGAPSMQEIGPVTTTRYTVGGLSPYSDYEVRVVAVNGVGRSALSGAARARTGERAPSTAPWGLHGRMVSPSNALLQWQEPAEPNGQIRGYRVYSAKLTAAGTRGPVVTPPLSSWMKRSVENVPLATLSGLEEGALYAVRVLAFTNVGDGPLSPEIHIIAQFGVPSQPISFKAEAESDTSMLLSWLPPRQENILKYELLYREGDTGPERRLSLDPTMNHVLEGLRENTLYSFRLAGRSLHGLGPYSPTVTARTLPTRGFAMNFRIKAMMPTSVLLSWEVPDSPGSNERLQIVYRGGHNMEVDAMRSHQLVVGLEADSLYSFMLNAGPNGGLLQVVSVRTVPQVHWSEPGELIGETGGDADGDMREHGLEPTLVPLPQLLGDLRVRMYLIVVVPLYNLEEQPIAWVSPNNMDFEERMSLRASEHLFVAAHMERLERPFVVARLEHLPPTFPIGDGHSRRLQPGLAYRVCVLALLHAPAQQASVYVSSPCSPPVLLEAQPVIGEDEGLVWVVGPVLATIIIIVIVIAILLYKRSKREAEVKGCLPAPSKDTGHSGSADPVQMRRLNHQTPGMEMHPPIPVSEFAGHVERLKANDNMLFSQEYESIDPGQQFTWDHSNLEINKHKNRYANVVAYDHSRVILHTIDGVPGSDYINANYIDGYRRHNAYIASQGPLADTVADFWRMVWEQRSSTIVMMTKLEERSRVKCDQYWPNRGSESYGLVQVTLTDTVELATYSTRSFTLTRSGCTERRDVRQFQFTAWPDHGVPEFPTPVLAFLRRVRAAWGSSADGGPLIVHCSAGVGRTGCLIVIDAALERVKHEHTVDVYGQVTCMRAQRNYMVQTEEQYAFVHTALVEAVSSGCTETPARSLHAHLQRLSQSVSHTEPRTTGLHLEFQRLQMSKLRVSTAPSGALPCNKLKNRLLTVIPPDSSRVALQAIRGTQGSDYINASYIDGYRQQRAYIATQGPLPETTEDLWRMLWEQNSTIVVMLTKLREMGREKCHQYWPAERSARYQYFVVDPMAEYKMPQYVLREFKVTDARDGQSRTVRQFQFTDWPEQGVPRSGEGFIDFIGQVHKTKEQFGQEGPITVHCSAGVGRTGVFVALSVVLERMRYEGLLDLFQTVKMMRTQRPGMVQTEDQYQFCYRAALEYLGSFDHYTV